MDQTQALQILQATEAIREEIFSSKAAYQRKLISRIKELPTRFLPTEKKVKLTERLEDCFRYLYLLENNKGEKNLQIHLCKSPLCPFCRYYYVKRQRKRITETLDYLKIPPDNLFLLIPTTVGCSALERGAADRFQDIVNKLHVFARKSRRMKNRPFIGGFYKIEWTLSDWTFRSGNWHYHANVLLDGMCEEQLRSFVDGAIDTKYTLEKVRPGYEAEVVKYSCKDINEVGDTLKPWNVDPCLEGSLDRLGELASMYKRRSLSAINEWWGMKKFMEEDRIDKQRTLWTNYQYVKREIKEELKPDAEMDARLIMSNLQKRVEKYKELYKRADNERKKIDAVVWN